MHGLSLRCGVQRLQRNGVNERSIVTIFRAIAVSGALQPSLTEIPSESVHASQQVTPELSMQSTGLELQHAMREAFLSSWIVS